MQRNPYWPLKGPSFFSVLKLRGCVFFLAARKVPSAQVKFRGADGRPTTEPSQETRVKLTRPRYPRAPIDHRKPIISCVLGNQVTQPLRSSVYLAE